jgi:hypothetical protein
MSRAVEWCKFERLRLSIDGVLWIMKKKIEKCEWRKKKNSVGGGGFWGGVRYQECVNRMCIIN